jgi:HAD superfamily hydrolase (TIGR01459 family)
MPSVSGLSALTTRYDALLLDLWGVVHDGSQLYPGVHDTLVALRKSGNKIIMISNAPRRANVVEGVLNRLGIEKPLYDGVISSGEAGYAWLAAGKAPWGKKYFYIGPNKDLGVLGGLDFVQVQSLSQADFVLNVGFGEDNRPMEETLPVLREAKEKNLPMLCLNPDLLVIKMNGERHPCAGALAKEYEALGGKVTWFGKPYAAVYDAAMTWLGNIPKQKILAVGDSLETDIPGAQNYGIDSLLITGGILKGDSEAEIAAECAKMKLIPTYILPAFRL